MMLSPEELELLDAIAAEGIEPVDPPPSVRERVLDSIRAMPGVTVRADEGRWSDVAAGVRMKKLARNSERGTMTFLLELAPNALLPSHDHEGGEDSYVVRGSCHIGAVALSAGDFHHVDAGAHHGDVVASAEGCLLLLTVDLADAA